MLCDRWHALKWIICCNWRIRQHKLLKWKCKLLGSECSYMFTTNSKGQSLFGLASGVRQGQGQSSKPGGALLFSGWAWNVLRINFMYWGADKVHTLIRHGTCLHDNYSSGLSLAVCLITFGLFCDHTGSLCWFFFSLPFCIKYVADNRRQSCLVNIIHFAALLS